MTTFRPGAAAVEFRGIDGITLRGDRWDVADRKGTVLLLHGGGQTRHSWRQAGERLAAAGWLTISLDARGHGDSDWSPDGKYDFGKFRGDLISVVSRLEDRPVLVGASMGGTASLVAAGENPGLARALVLVDVAPRMEAAGAERIHKFLRGAPDGFATLDDVAAAIRAYNPHRTRPATQEGLKKNVRQRADGRWYWHWDPAFLTPDGGSAERLGPEAFSRAENAARNLDVPTLLVRGKQSDLVSVDGVRHLLSIMKDAKSVDVSGAGHMVVGDDNDVFTHAVLDFLDGLETRSAPQSD